jgi:hypothetical protein
VNRPRPKAVPKGRKCALCGKPGGTGFTTALRLLGYNYAKGEIGYAHSNCLVRARRKGLAS